MATTTAAVTLSSDLMSANISVSASSTLMKAGTTADGLDQIEYAVVEIATGDEYDLIANTPTATKASKLYVKNHSIDETYFVAITQNTQAIGSYMVVTGCLYRLTFMMRRQILQLHLTVEQTK